MSRRVVLPALAALVLALSSCSIVPTSSPTVPITQAPDRPPQGLGFEPLPPAAGATPEEIVRGFVDAAASSVRGRPVAAEYLAPDAASSWSDANGITIVGQGYATVASESGAVELTAGLVGTVDTRGVFTVAKSELFSYSFPLAEVNGEWRITDPPETLVMLETDFERLYDPVDAYFLDPTGQQLVPDPRYLIRGEAEPTVLVERLIEGPSPTLAPGVRNPLAGVGLARRVTVEGQTATVDLTGLVVEPGTSLDELRAQLVWSLTQLEDRRIRSVVITVDGEPLALDDMPDEQTTDDWQAFDPEASPVQSVGHYVDTAGALRTVTDGAPAPGPAGQGTYRLSSAAATADVRTGELSYLVGVSELGDGATLLAGRYGGDLQPVPLPGVRGTISAPTVAATSPEVWVVRDGTEIVRVPPATGQAQRVNAPTLPGLGRAQAIELSPDGVRVALIVSGDSGPRVYVGTVVDDETGPAVRDLLEVAPTLTPVVDVAWRSPGQLWLLAGDPEDRQPYSVGVDGWDLAAVRTSGLPAPPTSLGAAPGRLPLAVAGGTLWQWSGGTWVTLVRGQEPLPGSAPFYPL